MRTNNERGCARELSILAMSLLAGMAEHADEAGLGDFALHLTMAGTELALGPWARPVVDVSAPVERVELVEGMNLVLDLIDAIRLLTDDLTGVVALALARLWVVDGVRCLDREAARAAEGCRAAKNDGRGAR